VFKKTLGRRLSNDTRPSILGSPTGGGSRDLKKGSKHPGQLKTKKKCHATARNEQWCLETERRFQAAEKRKGTTQGSRKAREKDLASTTKDTAPRERKRRGEYNTDNEDLRGKKKKGGMNKCWWVPARQKGSAPEKKNRRVMKSLTKCYFKTSSVG